MRATVVDSLPDVATIISRTYTPDGMGGQTASWTNSGPVECRIAPSSAMNLGEQLDAGAERSINSWLVTLEANVEISATDRIVVGTVNLLTGRGADRTFEVLSISARRSWELHTAVACQEVL